MVSWHSKVRSWIECDLKKCKNIYWKLPFIKKCQFSLGFGLFLEIGSSNFNSDFTVVTCQSKLYGETPHMSMFKKKHCSHFLHKNGNFWYKNCLVTSAWIFLNFVSWFLQVQITYYKVGKNDCMKQPFFSAPFNIPTLCIILYNKVEYT